MKYAVELYLDWEHPPFVPSRKWIEDRIKLFHEFTLKSILNQTFQDFEIWMQCNPNYRDITENASWDERVYLIYDRAKSKLAELDDDYLVITRMDTDDLFHKDALQDIKDNVITSDKRECLIFRQCIVWERVSGFIARWHRKSPPFHTHIFPKHVYQNFSEYERLHYISHSRAGGKLLQTKELSSNKICVVEHSGNSTDSLGGKLRVKLDLEKVKNRSKGKFITCDHNEMVEILKDFGVREQNV